MHLLAAGACNGGQIVYGHEPLIVNATEDPTPEGEPESGMTVAGPARKESGAPVLKWSVRVRRPSALISGRDS